MALENSIFAGKHEICMFIQTNYQIRPLDIIKLSEGSANCYKVIGETENYFLKELQSKFTEEQLIREIEVCHLLNENGIATSQFVKNNMGQYICKNNGHFLHVQKFIEGHTIPKNQFNNSLLKQSAKLLGRINGVLQHHTSFPAGFPNTWFEEWSLERTIEKYEDKIDKIANRDLDEKLKQKLTKACKTKISLLQNFNLNYIEYIKLKKVNGHGDYNNLQLICNKDITSINAVIDFSSAASIPAVWEIIRSYTYSAPECIGGNKIKLESLKSYIDEYLQYFHLPLFDVVNMAPFYYFNLLRSSYGFDSNDEQLIRFALWRTELCEYLSKTHTQISTYLYEQYYGKLK